MEYLKLVTIGGQHMLQMPDGKIIPGVIFTRVYDGPDKSEPSHVIAKIFVEILDKPINNKTDGLNK